MVSNFVGSFLKWYIATGGTGKYPASYYTDLAKAQLRAPFMDSVYDIMNAGTCVRQARGYGTFMSQLLNFQTPDATFFADLPENLGKE